MKTAEAHTELLEGLLRCRAKVVLSGYRSPLYDAMLEGWHTVEIAASTSQHLGGRERSQRTEVLWCNFMLQPDLFACEE